MNLVNVWLTDQKSPVSTLTLMVRFNPAKHMTLIILLRRFKYQMASFKHTTLDLKRKTVDMNIMSVCAGDICEAPETRQSPQYEWVYSQDGWHAADFCFCLRLVNGTVSLAPLSLLIISECCLYKKHFGAGSKQDRVLTKEVIKVRGNAGEGTS